MKLPGHKYCTFWIYVFQFFPCAVFCHVLRAPVVLCSLYAGLLCLWYINIIPTYNVSPYLSLKDLGEKCSLHTAKYGVFQFTHRASGKLLLVMLKVTSSRCICMKSSSSAWGPLLSSSSPYSWLVEGFLGRNLCVPHIFCPVTCFEITCLMRNADLPAIAVCHTVI